MSSQIRLYLHPIIRISASVHPSLLAGLIWQKDTISPLLAWYLTMVMHVFLNYDIVIYFFDILH